MTKVQTQAREPLSWKGGLLVPLFKGKGSPKEAASYRSIFISDVCGKIHHSHVRKALVDTWNVHDDLIQQGGRKGYSTDIAHHLLHGYFAWARSQTVSCAMLFVDAAFYTVVRSMLSDQPLHDDLLCHAMQVLGIRPHDWHEILRCIRPDNATSGMDDHAHRMMIDMFSGTHFQMKGVANPVATFRGTRPGDPVADVLFNMVFRLIVLDARTKFQGSHNMPFLGSPEICRNLAQVADMPPSGFTEVTFVDDIAYALHAPCAEQVVTALQTVASCLHDAATSRGMQLNYAAGKTEAMIFCAGPGSRAVKKQLWHDYAGSLPIVTEHGTQTLRLVHSYKHLGSFLQCQAVVHKDATYRVAQARKAFGQLARPFYSKRNVGLATKTSVFSMLVVSRLLYNVHVWAWVTDADVSKWSNGIREAIGRLVRPLLHQIPAFHFTVAELCGLASLPGPSDLLHANRLRYLTRAIAAAPELLWRTLFANTADTAWMALLQSSFVWFIKHYPGHFTLPVDDVHACLQYVAVDERWIGRVKQALASAVRYHRAAARGHLWSLKVERDLQKFASSQLLPRDSCVAAWSCLQCSVTFDTKRVLAVHSRHMHGYQQILKYFVLSDECYACGKKFFQRCRALTHVRQSARCRDAYLACFVPAAQEVVTQLDEADLTYAREQKTHGWRPSKAFLPVLRIPMPCLPAAGSEDARILYARWARRTPNPGTGFHAFEGIREQLPQVVLGEDEIIPFLGHVPAQGDPGQAGVYQIYDLAAETARLHIQCFLFIHFYSGYRREGDLQHCLEAQFQQGTAQVFCLSIDICLAKQRSDVTDPSTQRFWVDQMAKGQILGIGGGPSCETWSAARHMADGPPPVQL